MINIDQSATLVTFILRIDNGGMGTTDIKGHMGVPRGHNKQGTAWTAHHYLNITWTHYISDSTVITVLHVPHYDLSLQYIYI
jgi:hypothetical protein